MKTTKTSYYRKTIVWALRGDAHFKTLCQTDARGDALMSADIARHDPFQNGEHMTMPAWYVGRQMQRIA